MKSAFGSHEHEEEWQREQLQGDLLPHLPLSVLYR